MPSTPAPTPSRTNRPARHGRANKQGFTLIELLVVISIIAVLIGILLPALSAARKSARTIECLSNMGQMELAHQAYMTDHAGQLIEANLAHGGIVHTDAEGNPISPWFETLRSYSSNQVAARSPLDNSPHWGPATSGQPIPGAPPDQRRLSSYGINNFLNTQTVPWGGPYTTIARIDSIAQPTSINHFLVMSYTGPYAGADHPHIENWFGVPNAPAFASTMVQINHAGGPKAAPQSLSNWSYLDGHVATEPFRNLFTDIKKNRFDPRVAR